MKIGSLCNRNVVAVSRDMTVTEAASLMRHHHIGDVLVQDHSGERPVPIGIVTDRDIVVEVVAAELDPRTLKLGDLLVSPLVTADAEDSCEDTVRLMALNGVRRMPVVDDDGALVGVVTLDDLLPHFAAPLAQLSELAARGREREMATRR
jgi:CBS domain-containing protein